MKRMDKQLFLKTVKIFVVLTVIITVVGYMFGNILTGFVETGQPVGPLTGAPIVEGATDLEAPSEDVSDEGAAVAHIWDPSSFYMIQLGVFGSLDNAAGLMGTLNELGLPSDVIRVDGNFMLYSHIVGERGQLNEVEALLERSGVDFFVRQERAPGDELAWQYFVLAANETPFHIDEEFINGFANNEMPIFGIFYALSSSSFEPLSQERQQMLMAIFNWLNS